MRALPLRRHDKAELSLGKTHLRPKQSQSCWNLTVTARSRRIEASNPVSLLPGLWCTSTSSDNPRLPWEARSYVPCTLLPYVIVLVLYDLQMPALWVAGLCPRFTDNQLQKHGRCSILLVKCLLLIDESESGQPHKSSTETESKPSENPGRII
jgi:hypothetical protein